MNNKARGSDHKRSDRRLVAVSYNKREERKFKKREKEIKYGGERNTNIVSEHSPPVLLTVICVKVKTIIKLNVLTDREKYDTMETLYKKECCYGNLLS